MLSPENQPMTTADRMKIDFGGNKSKNEKPAPPKWGDVVYQPLVAPNMAELIRSDGLTQKNSLENTETVNGPDDKEKTSRITAMIDRITLGWANRQYGFDNQGIESDQIAEMRLTTQKLADDGSREMDDEARKIYLADKFEYPNTMTAEQKKRIDKTRAIADTLTAMDDKSYAYVIVMRNEWQLAHKDEVSQESKEKTPFLKRIRGLGSAALEAVGNRRYKHAMDIIEKHHGVDSKSSSEESPIAEQDSNIEPSEPEKAPAKTAAEIAFDWVTENFTVGSLIQNNVNNLFGPKDNRNHSGPMRVMKFNDKNNTVIFDELDDSGKAVNYIVLSAAQVRILVDRGQMTSIAEIHKQT